jgi:hypothetical protein
VGATSSCLEEDGQERLHMKAEGEWLMEEKLANQLEELDGQLQERMSSARWRLPQCRREAPLLLTSGCEVSHRRSTSGNIDGLQDSIRLCRDGDEFATIGRASRRARSWR